LIQPARVQGCTKVPIRKTLKETEQKQEKTCFLLFSYVFFCFSNWPLGGTYMPFGTHKFEITDLTSNRFSFKNQQNSTKTLETSMFRAFFITV